MKDYIFEENKFNELSEEDKKKELFNAIINTRVQAEMDKLDNEESKLNSMNIFSKLFGAFDGSTYYKKENINFKRFVINDKLERSSLIKDDIDIHDSLADIELFMEDNKLNSLISDEIQQLNNINKYIYNNFNVENNKVQELVTNRKQSFLPVLTRKLTKQEQLKSESIKYLNKQGYNK